MKLTLDQGNQVFSNKLGLLLNELGFVIDSGDIKRQKTFGLEQILYSGLKSAIDNKFALDYSAVKRIDPIDEIIDDYFLEFYQFEMTKSVKTSVLAFNAKRVMDYKFDPSNLRQWIGCNDYYVGKATEEGVEQMAIEFFNVIKLHIIPVFDKYNNIQLLDRLINETPKCFYEVIHLFTGVGLEYKKMIIAKLAGNKDYELICEVMKQRILEKKVTGGRVTKETFLSVWERIYERLKKVEPLANPILD